MKRLLSIFLIISVFWQGQAQASVAGSAVRVSTVVAGALEQQLVRRGFAANDPRFQLTLDAVSVAANDAVFNAGTIGMTVAGVAGLPVWGTVAIGLGVAALTFGAYQLLTQPVSVVDPVTGAVSQKYAIAPSSMSLSAIQAAAAAAPAPAPSSTSNFSLSPSVVFPQVQALDPASCAMYWECSHLAGSTSVPFLIASDGYGAVPISTVGDFQTYVNYRIALGNDFGDAGNPNLPAATPGHVVWTVQPSWVSVPDPFGGMTYSMQASATIVYDWQWTGSNDANGYKIYQARTDGYYDVVNYNAQPNSLYAPPPNVGTFDQLMANLTPEQQVAPLSNASAAEVANALLQAAAAKPGYGGFPAPITDPITAQDVANWSMTHPGQMPYPADLLNPIVGPVTVPNPYAAPAPLPDSYPTPTPTPQVDLGPDPGIGAPSLEATPTAQMILNPILNLFPDLKSFVVPSHSSVCPAPSMSLFDKSLVLDGHCTLLEAVRPTLYAVMAFVWVVIGLFIILAA